ncbi:hypothetical protein ACIA5A_30345 [Micromonospora sp. NPDC051300]|uniref:hypothetical protein n=1 Tax=Micromonospora sp. NPDC051300 TaxID=3364286 RepID=UPI0037A0E71E
MEAIVSDRSTPAPKSGDAPEELLASVVALRRRTRALRHAFWFPLLLFGLLTVMAAPLYIESADPFGMRAPAQNPVLTSLGGDFLERSATLGWYWLVALVGGYLISLWWYRRHGERVGVQTRTRAYLVSGVVGTLVGLLLPIALRFLLLNSATTVSNETRWLTVPLMGIANRGMLPHLVIAVGLMVLARLERSRVLAAVAVGYGVAVLLVNLYFHVMEFQPGDLHRLSLMLAALMPSPVLIIGGAVALRGTTEAERGEREQRR